MSRKGARAVPTVVSDKLPEHRPANAGIEASRQTDGIDEQTTSQRLFGDLIQDANPALEVAPISQHPESDPEEHGPREPEPIPTPETPQTETPASPQAPQEPETPAAPPPSSDDEFIDIDALATKRVRTKVDGKEEIVTLKELRDRAQLKKHLDEAADRVGEERRRLAEERRQLQELRQQRDPAQFVGGNFPTPANAPITSLDAPDNALSSRIQFLEQRLNEVTQSTQPVVWQTMRQRVSDDLKREGHSDFLDYIPKMEAEIAKLADPNLAQFYDTPTGAKSLFYQLKTRDLMEAGRQRSSLPIQATPPAAAPMSSTRPPITRIDGGSQPSTAANDDSRYQYGRTFRRATALGDDREAWNEVLRQKGILPE